MLPNAILAGTETYLYLSLERIHTQLIFQKKIRLTATRISTVIHLIPLGQNKNDLSLVALCIVRSTNIK